jgi:hypothetical protein
MTGRWRTFVAKLHRTIPYSVEEHKRERVHCHEFEDQMKLAAAQLENENELQAFRKAMQKWLERSGKGHQASS